MKRIYDLRGIVFKCGMKTKLNKMEENKMSKEKKELIKKFKVVIDDLMDHYEEYTDEEKAQVKEIFQKVAELNTILDKYDIDVKFDWAEYSEAYNQYFGMMLYWWLGCQLLKADRRIKPSILT